ncbi:MAG TPA: hypothetical protein ENK10_03255, partial [Acidobacteria bacterium]|nr:hypothetical protein [Acidobacteriota bacterium]
MSAVTGRIPLETLVVLVALVGPSMVASPRQPTAAAAAAALLPPLARVVEAPLEGGGWLRAEGLRQTAAGVEVWGAGIDRQLGGARLAGPVSRRRLWLGSDAQGRDLVGRVARGARRAVLVALPACLLALLLASAVGLLRARSPGPVAHLVGLLTDGTLALPTLLVMLVFAAALAGRSWGLALAIAAVGWAGPSRLVYQRAEQWRVSEAACSTRAVGA